MCVCLKDWLDADDSNQDDQITLKWKTHRMINEGRRQKIFHVCVFFSFNSVLLKTHNTRGIKRDNKLRVTANILSPLFELCMISDKFLWSQVEMCAD